MSAQGEVDQIAELNYQLRLAQLELMKSNVLRELAEHDAAGVKATLKELRADSKNKDVMYNSSQAMVDDLIIERDGYKTALGDIRTTFSSSTSPTAQIMKIGLILRGIGQ